MRLLMELIRLKKKKRLDFQQFNVKLNSVIIMNQIIKDEKKVNNSTREYIEKAYRLLHDHITGKFNYV